uniref:Elongator complex protein 6 n=1 Tax=Anopheles stephensi TaxID=30069 RepID=A0A182XVQ5_ANOST
MVWDILSVCGWPVAGSRDDPPMEPPRVTLLQEQSGVDGSFLLAMLMTNHLKQSADNHVLLVAANHNAAHYTAACQKLTFNTASAIQTGQLCIVDVLAELYASGGSLGSPELLQLINGRISGYDKRNTLIIVDDLTFYSTMHSAGSGENAVIDFIEQLLHTTTAAHHHRMVLKVNASECYERLCTFLIDLADVTVSLGPLPSGSFRELDGILTVHRKQSAYPLMSAVREQSKTLLYKVHDRMVRTYVHGEVGIKNL